MTAMKLMRLLQTDLYRGVVHADFWIAALLFGALCFTAEGYWDAGRSITVLELALSYRQRRSAAGFCSPITICFWPGLAPIT